MKRIISILLIIITAFVLFSCSENSTDKITESLADHGDLKITFLRSCSPDDIAYVNTYLSKDGFDMITKLFNMAEIDSFMIITDLFEGYWKLTLHAMDLSLNVLSKKDYRVNITASVLSEILINIGPGYEIFIKPFEYLWNFNDNEYPNWNNGSSAVTMEMVNQTLKLSTGDYSSWCYYIFNASNYYDFYKSGNFTFDIKPGNEKYYLQISGHDQNNIRNSGIYLQFNYNEIYTFADTGLVSTGFIYTSDIWYNVSIDFDVTSSDKGKYSITIQNLGSNTNPVFLGIFDFYKKLQGVVQFLYNMREPIHSNSSEIYLDNVSINVN